MDLEAHIAALVAREVDRRLAERAGEHSDDWVSQAKSPLGRKLHTKLWRLGVLPGLKVHRRILVRRRDLEEYIARHGVPAPPRVKPANDSASAEAIAFARSGARRVAR